MARPPDPGSGRAETEEQRLDRNVEELLGELRLAVPGVQVLFAFLLIAPFNQRFSTITPGQERLYLVALVAAGLAAVLLIAPSAQHRVTFRTQDKDNLVRQGNMLAIVGLMFLGIAMTAAVWLVTDFVFGALATAVCVSAVALAFTVLWFGAPALRRLRSSG